MDKRHPVTFMASNKELKGFSDTAAKERAVIEGMRELKKHGMGHMHTASEEGRQWAMAWSNACSALDALDALTEPQPVKPEDLEPGQRFRVPDRGSAVWRLTRYRGGAKCFAIDEDGYLADMGGIERVIPLKDQE